MSNLNKLKSMSELLKDELTEEEFAEIYNDLKLRLIAIINYRSSNEHTYEEKIRKALSVPKDYLK